MLQLDDLGLVDAEPARTALAARNSSDGVFVAIEGRRSDLSERSDRIVVVEASPETGAVERVLLDRSGRSGVVDAFVSSPDGTLIGVAVVMVEDDGSESRDIVVIEVATGEVISTVMLPDLARNCLLAFAGDNGRLACAGRVYDVSSGALLGGTEEFEDIAIESGWVRMGFRSVIDVQADPDETGNEIRMTLGGEERTFASAPPTLENPTRGELSFRPDGDRLIHHRRSFDPDRAEIVIYRVDDLLVAGRILRNDAVHDVAWRGANELVTITADLEIVIYEID